MSLPVIAGSISTLIFALSMLPMLLKALRTKDLASYSPANIVLSNVGNVIHSVYIYDLPMGPVWALHSFYLVSTGLMLIWYVRYATLRHYTESPMSRTHPRLSGSVDAAASADSLA